MASVDLLFLQRICGKRHGLAAIDVSGELAQCQYFSETSAGLLAPRPQLASDCSGMQLAKAIGDLLLEGGIGLPPMAAGGGAFLEPEAK
jgi:hypothetical protein